MTAILLGVVASAVCFFFVTTVKNKLSYDDTLDVFGIHCVGGIIGAIGTGIVADPALGGQGWIDYTVSRRSPASYDMAAQVMTQIKAVVLTLLCRAASRRSCSCILKYDHRACARPREVEHEGLDINEHGERAYNY